MDEKTLNAISYFLGGAGKAIGGQGSFGDTVGSMAMGQAKTNNFNLLLKKALAGGGKVSFDSEGFNLKGPNTVLQTGLDALNEDSEGFSLGATKVGALKSPAGVPAPTSASVGGSMGGMNSILPFSSDSPVDISSADLVGLAPEDIQLALHMAEGIKAQPWERMKDAINMEHTIAQIEGLRTPKDDRSEAQKAFDLLNKERLASGEKPLSFKDFYSAYKNQEIQEYQLYQEQGGELNFNDWKTALKKAGGTTIDMGDLFQKVVTTKKAEQFAELRSNDYMIQLEEASRKEFKDSEGLDFLLLDSETAEKLTTDERVKFRALELFTENISNMIGKENVRILNDPEKETAYWIDTRDETLIRSYKYGTIK